MGGDMPEKSRVKGDIRTSQHHDSAVKHVSGRAIYVDDIATSPGSALKSLESAGVMRVRENYGPYDPPSRFNRCLRTYNRGVMCLPWGFSVAEYRARGV